MKQDRKPFLPVTSDIDDERIERLAQEKGVASMVKPAPATQRAGEEAPVKPTRKAVEPSQSTATPRSKMKAVNLELPDYAWTDLKIRAAQMQTSVRHIVMKALKADGIAIRDVDMVEDGRRDRGSHQAS